MEEGLVTKLEKIKDYFHTNIINFLDELIDLFPDNTSFILFRVILKDKIPKEQIINTFIQKVLPYKEEVKNRDENFFLNSCKLLEEFDSSQISTLKIMWKSNMLDENDRAEMWQWFDTFIFLAEKYQTHKLELAKSS